MSCKHPQNEGEANPAQISGIQSEKKKIILNHDAPTII
jgi:hypothetical protein